MDRTGHSIEKLLGNVLRSGVLLAAAIVLMGGVLYLSRYGSNLPNYKIFHGEPEDLRSLPGVVTDVISGRRRGLIQFGLLVLIATPIVRVAFSILVFIRERDYLYVAITLIVFSILIYSVAGNPF